MYPIGYQLQSSVCRSVCDDDGESVTGCHAISWLPAVNSASQPWLPASDSAPPPSISLLPATAAAAASVDGLYVTSRYSPHDVHNRHNYDAMRLWRDRERARAVYTSFLQFSRDFRVNFLSPARIG